MHFGEKVRKVIYSLLHNAIQFHDKEKIFYRNN
jgi:hypothetical protein